MYNTLRCAVCEKHCAPILFYNLRHELIQHRADLPLWGCAVVGHDREDDDFLLDLLRNLDSGHVNKICRQDVQV